MSVPITHLLDTSVYCQPLKPTPLESVRRRWERLGDEALGVSVLCDAEVQFGLHLKGSENLWRKYEELLRGRFRSYPINDEVCEAFAKFKADARRLGQPCPDLDLLIAATATTHKLIVATLNARHFRAIEGLTVEDWSM